MSAHGKSDWGFDVGALKREFPALSDQRLHYLDNAATAQMPEVVLDALRRLEVESRANVHGGVHRLARASVSAYDQARNRKARFLRARSPHEIVAWGPYRLRFDQVLGAKELLGPETPDIPEAMRREQERILALCGIELLDRVHFPSIMQDVPREVIGQHIERVRHAVQEHWGELPATRG